LNLASALLYFLREACRSLLRSWKISFVAVLTMGIGLFLCSLFLLAFQNISSLLESWSQGLRIVVYLQPDRDEAEYEALAKELENPSWVASVSRVSAEEAGDRFREAFPSLSSLTRDWEEPPFPASLEASIEAYAIDDPAFDTWLEALRSHVAALMVDADQDWLGQLSTFLGLVTGAGITLGLVFLTAAVLTGASILRLVAHLQREEIAIMRLVGATEFFVRGPFYVEGLIQGLSGAILALLTLGVITLLADRGPEQALWSGLLFGQFLSLGGCLSILAVGGVTGILGAVVSLRREGREEGVTG